MTIYLDLDGVFADFSGAVQKHCLGMTYNQHADQIWRKIETVPNFFLTLDILPDCYQIHHWAEWLSNDVQFLTALPRLTGQLKTAQRDKVDWVHRTIDRYAQVNVVSNWDQKQFFCRNDYDVLIDDSERNIDQWREAGGIGILHTSVTNTIDQLKKLEWLRDFKTKW